MNSAFWLSVAFLMSRIDVFQAATQCRPSAEYSTRGMFLRGHTFKTYKIEWHESCHFRCAEEVTCQSYNYVIGLNLCELNNRTKEARPEDFMPDRRRFYMKRTKNRGTLQSSSFVCLSVPTRPFWMLQLGQHKWQDFALRGEGGLVVNLSLVFCDFTVSVRWRQKHKNTRKLTPTTHTFNYKLTVANSKLQKLFHHPPLNTNCRQDVCTLRYIVHSFAKTWLTNTSARSFTKNLFLTNFFPWSCSSSWLHSRASCWIVQWDQGQWREWDG